MAALCTYMKHMCCLVNGNRSTSRCQRYIECVGKLLLDYLPIGPLVIGCALDFEPWRPNWRHLQKMFLQWLACSPYAACCEMMI